MKRGAHATSLREYFSSFDNSETLLLKRVSIFRNLESKAPLDSHVSPSLAQ